MTHFRVAVIQTTSIDDMYGFLARYDENLEVAPHIDITRDEALAKAREDVAEAKDKVGAGNSDPLYVKLASHFDDADEELLEWYASKWCCQERDADGNFLTSYNPDSKYDYFSVIEEISFEQWLATGSDKSEEELESEFAKLVAEGDGFWRGEYYTSKYGDAATFAKVCKLPCGWAVVTPDGDWHEPGHMGWFACDDASAESNRRWAEEFEEKLIAPYKDAGATVALLDCHI